MNLNRNILIGAGLVATAAAGYGVFRFFKKQREDAFVCVSHVAGHTTTVLSTADGFTGMVPGHNDAVTPYLRDAHAVIANGEKVVNEGRTIYTKGNEQVMVVPYDGPAESLDDPKVLTIYFSDSKIAKKAGIDKYICTHATLHGLGRPDAVATE